MQTRDLSGKLVVVTGAASGIGRALALACAQRGGTLALCDLDEAGLTETSRRARERGARVLARTVDVAAREQMERFAQAVHEELGVVSLLVNNAGIGLGAGFLDTSLDDWDSILNVDLKGVVHGCHHFVPPMVERGEGGHVVNVASAAGLVPSQTLCAYSTAKFAVVGLSGALRQELAGHGIGVTAICPGVINTNIVNATRTRGWQAHPAAQARTAQLFARRNYAPERAAEAILRHVDKNSAIGPVAPEAWALYYARRWLPGLLERIDRMMVERAQAEIAAAARAGR